MHPIPSFRLLRARATRKLASLIQRRPAMNTPLRFGLLDDLLFLFALFAPVSLLLAGSFAVAALA